MACPTITRARLDYALDDIDVVQIGLLGSWRKCPSWISTALLRTIRTGRVEELAIDCFRTQQLGLLHKTLCELELLKKIPQTLRDRIDGSCKITDCVNKTLILYACDIHFLCEQLKIPHAFLKGMSSLGKLYSAIYLRQLKDIDILVTRDNAMLLFDALRMLGFSTVNKENTNLYDSLSQREDDIDNGYELPSLNKVAKVEIDFDPSINLADKPSRRFHVKGGQPFVRIQVEIHFSLSESLSIPWVPYSINHPLLGSTSTLTPTLELFFSVFKGYLDLAVLGKRHSVKLISDALRQSKIEAGQISWAELEVLVKTHKIFAPFRYFAHHATDTYGLTLPTRLDFRNKHDSADFGDFLPFVLRRRPSTVLRLHRQSGTLSHP